jgi:hypothetical protein
MPMEPTTRRGFVQFMTALVGGAAVAPKLLTDTAPPVEPLTDADLRALEAHGEITPLERYLKSRGIKPAHLARESGYSRQHLLRIRMGRMEPTRDCIKAVVLACRRISRERVRARDLFDLG